MCVRVRACEAAAKRLFIVAVSFTGGRGEGGNRVKDAFGGEKKEKGRGLAGGMGGGLSIRWDKSRFDLQHSSHPCRVASCAPPFLPPSFLSPSPASPLPLFLLPSRWRISELGFPRLLSEEAIMMFWNTKAFHAQTSA